MKSVIAVMAGVLVATGLAVSAAPGPDMSAAPGAQAAKIEAGKQVYAAQKCSMCHAIDGKGMKSYPLDGVGAKLSADDIKAWIATPDVMAAKLATKPKMKMKAYKLEAADLDNLVAYLASLK